MGPVVVEIDLALEQYGPEAASGRAGLRAALERSRARFFGDGKRGPQPFTFEETRATLNGLSSYFDSLQPATDAQRQLLTSARDLAKKFADTQMLMARQLANPFPPYVVGVVVCWASALFLGNGLVATPNALTVVAHLAGATAIGSAIFLMLELSQPYTGVVNSPPPALTGSCRCSPRRKPKRRRRRNRGKAGIASETPPMWKKNLGSTSTPVVRFRHELESLTSPFASRSRTMACSEDVRPKTAINASAARSRDRSYHSGRGRRLVFPRWKPNRAHRDHAAAHRGNAPLHRGAGPSPIFPAIRAMRARRLPCA